jgi:uncharacterized phage protein (TIGR01671 family)
MDREILFRGRTESGEWVEGDLLQIDGNCFIRVDEGFQSVSIKLVDPATVGQFTGLYDANKSRIFEGDIVSWNNKTYKVIEEDACFFALSESNTHWKQYLFGIRYLSEVIGNTHDTPELMEVKQ